MTKQGHEVRSFYREHDLMPAPEERARARGLLIPGRIFQRDLAG
jgi:hypothetical protein